MNVTTANQSSSRAMIIDGVRTPFARSYQSFIDFSAYELGQIAITGLLDKTGLEAKYLEHLIMGCVIHDPRTPNVARESLLAAGLPAQIPANTVSLACISSNVAATNLADMIKSQRVEVGIFGGLDTCSDPPIRLSRNLRRILVKLQKVRGPLDMLKHTSILRSFRVSDLKPDIPQVVEFSNGKSMGQGGEILAQSVKVHREEADKFALRSHQLAVKAHSEGYFKHDICPVQIPPKFKAILKDDGPRKDTTLESLARLRPAFDRKMGVSTAGNSSFLTDGAAAVLIMSEQMAKEQGLQPRAFIRDYVYRAGDALSEMLSGPALSIPALLERNGLGFDDIEVWELHEAFAAQMVANLKLVKERSFVRDRVGSKVYGEIPLEKLNIQGGSLSIGHPFGATGARLLMTAARRISESKGRYAVVSGCAAGGQGSAILLEKAN